MPGPGMELIGEEEKKELLEVIESGYLYRYGDLSDSKFKAKVWNLEREFAKVVGTKHALAVNSGTSALLTSLLSLGIGPGDEVIVPGYTFIASMTSIIFAKAIPILAEVDETLTLNANDVLNKITPKTKAIMLVHMLGNPGDIERINKIALEHDLFLVEDCAQACGATYHGKSVGSYGKLGAFSLNAYKTISAGDGGVVVTDDEKLYRRAFAIHDQGHFPLRQGVEQGNRTILGLNFRMNELTAAVAIAQLRKLPFIQEKLHENKERLKKVLKSNKDIQFRKIYDEKGDIGTLLTFFMPTKQSAEFLAKYLGTSTVAKSGWHVYSNMEHLLNKSTITKDGCPFTCLYYDKEIQYKKGMLPITDDLLNRAINISIGVSDAGLGSAYGITIKSNSEEIEEKGQFILQAIEEAIEKN